MKKILFFLLGIFMSFSVSTLYSQELQNKGLRITWPLNRTVIQQNALGTASFRFFAQWLSNGNIGPNAAIRFQYRISTIDMTNGNNPVVVSGHNWSSVSTATENVQRYYSAGSSISDLKVLAIPSNTGTISLPKGWYLLEMRVLKKPNFAGWSTASYTSVRFGIGDVFMIYGQSNAQGYKENNDLELISYTTDGSYVQRDAVSTIARKKAVNGEFKIKGLPIVTNNSENDVFSEGIRDDGFSKLEKTGNRENIYPNGDVSWSWAPLGDKLVAAGTPTLFINNAIQNAEISWLTNPNEWGFKRLRASLQTYGHILGLRGVLYHQGEKDAAKRLSDGNESYTYYGQKMTDLVDFSRTALGGQSLRWNFAKASYFTNPSNACYQEFNDPYCVHNNNINSANTAGNFGCIPLSNCTQIQNNNSSCSAGVNCSFIGVGNPNDWYGKFNNYNDYNNLLTNVQQNTVNWLNDQNQAGGKRGNINPTLISTDDLGLNARGPHQGIHFSGATLSNVAQRWKDIGISNGNPVESKAVYAYTAISKQGNGYKLTAPTGFDRYFWVLNDGDIYSALQSGASNEYTTNGLTSSEFRAITCYLGKSTGQPIGDNNIGWNLKFEITHPFLIPGYQSNKALTLSNNTINTNGNSSTQIFTVTGSNLTWQASESSDWFSIGPEENIGGGDGTTPITINITQNTSSANRTANITISEDGGGLSQIVTITQAAAGGTTTQLSSLTPTSAWQEWGTLQTNKSVEGNTLRIGNQSYAFGLGTHANSNIKYDLGGQYTTFSGKVGLDDEVDNSCGGLHQVRFVIKADGSTLYTSPVVTPTMAAVPFSVNVSGKNQLELVVEALNNFYCDHADWVDTQLVTGSGNGCPSIPSPTGVTASVATITAGQSTTLSATCGQGTVTWSTGQNANSITVSPTTSTTYTATCISGSCSSGSVSVAISVVAAGACTNLSNGLAVGAWQVTGHTLKVREFHGQKWLTQQIGTNPDAFVVRGANMLQRSDVTLYNSSYASQVGCFALQYSNYGGLLGPDETLFPTPAGFSKLHTSDGTPYYSAISAGPTCNNTFLTAEMATYKTTGDGTVHTNLNKNGTTLNINGTTYTKGIGTHAVSEIIYAIPPNQGFTTFMADVGRDQGAYGCNCGNQDIVFKVINNSTGAILAGPVTKGNYQSATALSANLSGVTSIKLIVEAGTDGAYWGDWANWANARLTCPNANARQINTETTETELFQILPNPNNGTFNVRIDAKTAGVVQFYLSNLNGVPLKNFEFNVEIGVSEHTVSVENLLPSTYLLKAIQGEKVEAKRLIIE